MELPADNQGRKVVLMTKVGFLNFPRLEIAHVRVSLKSMTIRFLIHLLLIAGGIQSLFLNDLKSQEPMLRYFESQYGFGKHLFDENDFKRSIDELKKAAYVHDFVSFSRADSLNYMIGCAYSKMKDYGRSNSYLARIAVNDSILFGKSALLSGKNFVLSHNYDSTILYCKSVLESNLLKTNSEQLTLLLASGYLLLNHAEPAKYELTKAGLTDSPLYIYSTDLQNFRPKNAFIAGSLSAIIPGAGKVYTNNAEHGLMSLFAIGLIGFRTAIEYNRGGINSTGFIIFGSAFLITYAANIIGSAVSARLFNEKRYNEIHSEILDFVYECD
jgi:hypothetical protein